MNRFFFSRFFFMFFFYGALHAQSFNKAKLDSLFDVLDEKNKAMGSLVLAKNGQVIYERTIGYSVLSDKEQIKATAATRYRIGSITKMFTAVMIFQLMEEKKLTLSTTLDKYYPSLPNAKTITVSHLMNHRSGLHNYTDRPDYAAWMLVPKTQDEIIDLIDKGGIDFEPDAKAAYSNSNYFILGCIIEKITKQSYAINLKNRIASKIKLSNTYAAGKTDFTKNESFSYQFENRWTLLPEGELSNPGGAGCIVSTTTDLAQFIKALFDLKLISSDHLADMKNIKDGYGMGMFRYPFWDQWAYGHTGGIDGFVSMLTYFPEDDLAVSYCSNGQVYPRNDILLGVLNIYYNKPYAIPDFKNHAVKQELLDRYVGVYSNKEIALKISITTKNNALVAQATGQPSFPLEAVSDMVFKYDPAKVQLEFNQEKEELVLKQGGGSYLFTKDK